MKKFLIVFSVLMLMLVAFVVTASANDSPESQDKIEITSIDDCAPVAIDQNFFNGEKVTTPDPGVDVPCNKCVSGKPVSVDTGQQTTQLGFNYSDNFQAYNLMHWKTYTSQKVATNLRCHTRGVATNPGFSI